MAAIPQPPHELFDRTPPGSPSTRLAFREQKNQLLRAALGDPPLGISSAIDAYLDSDSEELEYQSDEEMDQSDEEVDIEDMGEHKCCIAGVNLSSTTYSLLNILADTPRTKFNKDDSFNIIVDTGCTTSSTGFKEDFIPESHKQISSTITGISGKLKITQVGTVRYKVLDDKCNVKVLQTRAFLVPHLNSRLFSPQSFLREMRRNKSDLYGKFNLLMTADAITMSWPDNSVLTISYDARSLMPRIRAYHDASKIVEQLGQIGCVTSDANANLSHGQKDLLKWHYKLGHLDFKVVQWLNANNMLGTTMIPKSKIPAIKCEACQFGRQHRTPTEHITVKYHHFRESVGEDKGVMIIKIDTKEQKADIFMKGFPRETHEYIRKLLMGW
jgi:GAG-pre-integrase domain